MSTPVALLIITSVLGIATFNDGWRTGLIDNRNCKDKR